MRNLKPTDLPSAARDQELFDRIPRLCGLDDPHRQVSVVGLLFDVNSAPAGVSEESAGVVGGRQVTEARVGPYLVEVPPPGFQLGATCRCR